MTTLITGIAGFIGSSLAKHLLDAGETVIGLDNLSDYYDPTLKQARLDRLTSCENFSFHLMNIEDLTQLDNLFAKHEPTHVVHLAGQVGVRYSLTHPQDYVSANIVGSFHVIECAKRYKTEHLLIASTSSVYGANTKFPAQETDRADHPLTIYAASKRAVELMAHSYASLYNLPITMMRFFTVYGPWGRPDMAPFLFLDAIFNDRPIDVFNHGKMTRDFTFVDDLTLSLQKLMQAPPIKDKPVGNFDSLSPVAPHRVVNIGNADPIQLMDFIRAIETATGKQFQINMQEMQAGDMVNTCADTRLLQELTSYQPTTSINDGVGKLVNWYRSFYKY
ncbi:MAG: GDP-mannose 4,6-dehydratase [Robiginitomaculum sp.]|nr:GDP-mannose 4,6-dehydratase [Robiginitomaculum sp.]